VTKRVCIVSSGHMSTCPRMLKAADALYEEGIDVRWVSVRWTKSWSAHDDLLVRKRGWEADPVWMTDVRGLLPRLRSSLRFRARRAARIPIVELDAVNVFRTHTRAVDEIRDRIMRKPTDLIYAGTEGGMAPAFESACALGVPYALDLEDLYSASRGNSSVDDALARVVETLVLPDAMFCTVPSEPIAAAYGSRVAGEFAVVHNTFPLPGKCPDFDDTQVTKPLRLCWFSQTIGGDRGLEEVLSAIRISGAPVALRLMGNPEAGYRERFGNLANDMHPGITVSWDTPVPPDAVVDWCRGSDVGLCVEQPGSLNKNLCLSNKALVYPLAGLALACTETEGQMGLARDFGLGARYYPPGKPEALARIIREWSEDRRGLLRARRASWEAARKRWHWAHPEERGRLVGLVLRALNGRQ
jgi:hypothetical protein